MSLRFGLDYISHFSAYTSTLKHMKKIALVIALAIASLNAASAQAPLLAEEPAPLRFTLGMGITGGGEKLATTVFTDGTEQEIRAGGLVAFVGGVDYRIGQHFSVQGNVGFHVDNSTATNGDVHFRRFPVELLGYFNVSPKWRIGGGVRFVNAVKLSSSGAAGDDDYDFDNTVGAVLETEYMFSERVGMKIRAVSEKYKVKKYDAEFKGNHVGIFGNYYF